MIDFILDDFDLNIFTWTEVIFRAGLALSFGMILGLERDRKNKPIDFRAYMIICVTTCLLAIMGQELQMDFEDMDAADLDFSKLIAGVLTGIGFLGAGAIIKREDDKVVGTATGASVWAAGAIGLIIGFGFYGIACIAFLCVALTLFLGGFYVNFSKETNDKEEL